MSLPNNVAQRLRTIGSDIVVWPIIREITSRKAYRTIDVYRLKLSFMKSGIEFTDHQLCEFFDRLERTGVGKLKIQQRPLHTNFTWNYDTYDIDEVVEALASCMKESKIQGGYKPDASPIRPLAGSTTVVLQTPKGNTATIKTMRPMDRETALSLATMLTTLASDLS